MSTFGPQASLFMQSHPVVSNFPLTTVEMTTLLEAICSVLNNPAPAVNFEYNTFVPGLTFGGNNVGMSLSPQEGEYWALDRFVALRFNIFVVSKGSSVGNALVTNLPFPVAGSSNSPFMQAPFWHTINLQTAGRYVGIGTELSGGSKFALTELGDNLGSIAINDTYFTSGASRIAGTGFYFRDPP